MRDQLQTLSGHVISIQYHDPQTNFHIFKIKQADDQIHSIKGKGFHISPGCQIVAKGQFESHEVYGPQFNAESIDNHGPSSKTGIVKYLSSHLVKGVGKKTAELIVEALGEQTLVILGESPEKIYDVPGIGPARAKEVIDALQSQKHIQDIMVFLHSHGIGPARAMRLYRKYGNNTTTHIQDNPYQLIYDLPGFGFQSADKIALSLGVQSDAIIRLEAAIADIFHVAKQFGHCYLTAEQIIASCQKRIGADQERIEQAIKILIENHSLIKDSDEPGAIYQQSSLLCEQKVAALLFQLSYPLDPPVTFCETDDDIDLTDEQTHALKTLLSHNFALLTGGPGVGKTTIIRQLITSLKASGRKYKLCAPTGKAAKRLSQSSKEHASTIHRLLKYDPATQAFVYNATQPLPCHTLIIDEISMIDIQLMCQILEAISPQTQLILVGDPDQLPSVGPGNVIGDMIASNKLPVARLSQIFRQSSQSLITANAHLINEGRFPKSFIEGTKKDFDLVFLEDNANLTDTIQMCFNKLAKKDWNLTEHVQVLCPMIKGKNGTTNLNHYMQNALNPKEKAIIGPYRLGDKVIQHSNNYDKKVFNGDIGIISGGDKNRLIVDFGHIEVEYSVDELNQIQLAYATTIHKSQGSEYPVVIVCVLISHFMLLERNLLYTAITRGKCKVILITDRKAMFLCLKNQNAKARQTRLSHRIALASDDNIDYADNQNIESEDVI